MATPRNTDRASLAERVRPKKLSDIVGQAHLLSEGKALYEAFAKQKLHSMVFWGPPGSGKTTIAKLLSQQENVHFIALSAVLDNLKSIREAIAYASRDKTTQTVLFIDEVHRFNKSQQDIFLPHIEDGTILFIGATTENPSFELNNALLSRLRVYVLNPLSDEALFQSLTQGKSLLEQENQTVFELDDACQKLLIEHSARDARRLLNTLELVFNMAYDSQKPQHTIVSHQMLAEALSGNAQVLFDKRGDVWYDQISALHKSIRGSSPDAALYWYCRMLAGGCDPLYVARRLLAIASEDIGNADIRALPLALAAWQTYERLGAAEGERAIAHACVYLACAPKSNSIDQAFAQAKALVKQTEGHAVPLHLRNAPTAMMKAMAFGKAYRYAHNEPQNYAAGENYFPEALKNASLYTPQDQGLEIKIKEKLDRLKVLDQKSDQQRYP